MILVNHSLSFNIQQVSHLRYLKTSYITIHLLHRCFSPWLQPVWVCSPSGGWGGRLCWPWSTLWLIWVILLSPCLEFDGLQVGMDFIVWLVRQLLWFILSTMFAGMSAEHSPRENADIGLWTPLTLSLLLMLFWWLNTVVTSFCFLSGICSASISSLGLLPLSFLRRWPCWLALYTTLLL